MVASNIAVTHSDVGLTVATVTAAARISPHIVRLTFASDDFRSWRNLGFDQWFRLAVPTNDATRFDNLSDTFGMGGYMKYLTLPRGTRPVIRNYTVRELRSELGEMDVDFVVHGDEGVAGPWAASYPVGAHVGLIDQGCGYRDQAADTVLLVGDESAMPAVLGVLRDMDRAASGFAIIEISDVADAQHVDAPIGMDVRWVVREHGLHGDDAALAEVRALPAFAGTVTAFAVGESRLATGVRRHLVAERGVPKDRVTFSGYWKRAR